MYRPQYFFQTPAGYRDEPFVRPVSPQTDGGQGIAGGQFFWNFPVEMDTDFPQIIRSLAWQGEQQGQSAGPLSGSIQIQLRDAQNYYLTGGFIPLWLYCWVAGSTPPDGGSGRAKVFETELYCPAGSLLVLDFFVPDGSGTYPGILEFRGVKRIPEGCAS